MIVIKHLPYQEHSVQFARFLSQVLMLPHQAEGPWDCAPGHVQWLHAVSDPQTTAPLAHPPRCRIPVERV